MIGSRMLKDKSRTKQRTKRPGKRKMLAELSMDHLNMMEILPGEDSDCI